MSKLAHSNQETMDEINSARMARDGDIPEGWEINRRERVVICTLEMVCPAAWPKKGPTDKLYWVKGTGPTYEEAHKDMMNNYIKAQA